MWEVLEHIADEDLPQLFENIRAHLKPDGIFVGSIALGPDDHGGASYHRTVKPRDWWEQRFAALDLPMLADHNFAFEDFCRGTSNGPIDGNYRNEPHVGFHFVAGPTGKPASKLQFANACVKPSTISNLKGHTVASRQLEIEIARSLAPKAVFVLGFARSSTTIVAEIINTAPDALILGEANWYIPNAHLRFRDWYNEQHTLFENQISKISHAPDFIPEKDHSWWEWLQSASVCYPVLGDKMAFSAQHFDLVQPSKIQSFFEARFLLARYVLTIRDPNQTLLSTAHLFSIRDDFVMLREIMAWLEFIKLWADWVRTFPNTLTLIAKEIGPHTIDQLEGFLDLRLQHAALLLDKDEQRFHEMQNALPILEQTKGRLTDIFECVKAALSTDRVLWQADQDRRLSQVDTR